MPGSKNAGKTMIQGPCLDQGKSKKLTISHSPGGNEPDLRAPGQTMASTPS